MGSIETGCEFIFDRDQSLVTVMVARSARARPGRQFFEPILDYIAR